MKIRYFLSIIIPILLFSSNAFADYLEDALRYAEQKKWDKAFNAANAYNNPVLLKIIQSKQFLDTEGKISTFEQMTSFATLNPNWPRVTQIKQNAEDRITSSTRKDVIVKWFSEHKPLTPKGYKFYALSAKGHISDQAKLQKVIKEGWIYGNFTDEEEKKFFENNKSIITEDDHIKKIDALLWNDQKTHAQKFAFKRNVKAKAYFQAFIALKEDKPNKNALFHALPNEYKYYSGILYNYLLGFKKDDIISHDTAKLILHVKKNDLHASEWWKLQNLIAKNVLQQGHYNLAYKIVSSHNGQCAKDSSEAEWLAGWIALRFLNDPKAAYTHFQSMYSIVKQPISVARGAYWLGVASTAMKNREGAAKWFREAATYNFTFYGQVAMLELKNHHIALPPMHKITKADRAFYAKNEFATASNIFIKHGRQDYALTFAKAAINNAHDTGEVALIVDSLKVLKNRHYTTEIAKAASQKGHIITHANYPTPYKFQAQIEPALTYSIILRESVFDQYAISHANAHGLMQVLPSTACKTAKTMKAKCNTKRLTQDAAFNISLGNKYLRSLIDRYQGSYLLAIAAYNAGPDPVDRWIVTNGDPRKFKDTKQIIHWIESIPYWETREYVQRVLENVQVYRKVLTANANLGLAKDLMRGSTKT